MSIKLYAKTLTFASLALLSCSGPKAEQEEEETDTPSEVLLADEDETTICEQEIEEAEEDARLDGSFDDFLYAFLQSRHLRKERTIRPLTLMGLGGKSVDVTDGVDGAGGLDFLCGDYFTELYASVAQFDSQYEEVDTAASIERINLCDSTVRTFRFGKQGGKWYLQSLVDARFSEHDLCQFLRFYSHFSADSAYQLAHLADPLHISVQDGDDEYIDGTIDPNQWTSFCTDVPKGVISNIRRGQAYSTHHMVLRKCGLANGLQEVFTFHRNHDTWHLTSYEN